MGLPAFLLLLLLLAALSPPSSGATNVTNYKGIKDTVKVPELQMVPRKMIFNDYMGLYAYGLDLDAIHLADGKTTLVTESHTLINMGTYQGKLYYMRGVGLYHYDWNQGFFIMKSIIHFTEPWSMVSTDHGIYWLCDPFDTITELWTSKGTPESTQQVTLPTLPSDIIRLYNFKNKLIFAVAGSLYYYTPTSGTVLVKDYCDRFCTNPTNFVFVGNKVFFMGYDEVDTGLWRSDLTTAGTEKFCNTTICKALSTPTVLGNQLLFFNTAPSLTLYSINTTDATTLLLKTFAEFDLVANMPDVFAVSGKILYFLLAHKVNKNCIYLFRSDGTVQGTQQWADAKCENVVALAGGFLKPFSYSPNGTTVTTVAFQEALVNSTLKTTANVTSTYLTIFQPFTRSWINLEEMCTDCNGRVDYSYFWSGHAWYFTMNGLHEIVFGKVPTYSSDASSLHPATLLLAMLVGLLVVQR